MYCPCGQSVSHIMPMWPECIKLCGLHDQYVSVYIAHVIRVYQAMRSSWSACFSIYCPCDQSVSPYVVSICDVYMVSMYCPCGQNVSHVVRVYPMLTECIPCGRSVSHMVSMWCPCGQSVSQYDVSIYAVYIASMFRHIAPMWS